jgi:hypothetical protein
MLSAVQPVLFLNLGKAPDYFYLFRKTCYTRHMKQKPLSNTNIYLQDPQKRRQAVVRSVLSSSAVEGIRIDAHELEQLQHVSGTPKHQLRSAR